MSICILNLIGTCTKRDNYYLSDMVTIIIYASQLLSIENKSENFLVREKKWKLSEIVAKSTSKWYQRAQEHPADLIYWFLTNLDLK